ncbi:putative transcription factor interactor and regulator CCHC(Zn) family [Helianthus anomalus]
MNGKAKQFVDLSRENGATIMMLKATMMDKQPAINFHLDTITLLKQESATVKIETERVNKKLFSYSTSSYVLDHIFQKQPKESEYEEKIVGNRKGSGYYQGVEKTLTIKLKTVQNQIDQLPDEIDVSYTKSDVCESEFVNDVFEKVFEDEQQSNSTNFESSNSHFEDEEFVHKNYIPNSNTRMNDDPIMVMYKMIGSDKLFSDDEFPIQNVNLKRLEKVFKLVEIEVLKVENLARTASYFNYKKDKSYYTKPRNSFYQKKIFRNERAGLGYNKKNHKKKFQKSNFGKKMKFVRGISSERDKGSRLVETNEEFFAQKKQHQQVIDSTNKTCFRCSQFGHITRRCPQQNMKPVYVEKKRKIRRFETEITHVFTKTNSKKKQ